MRSRTRDYLYLPSNVTFFTAIPTGAVIDGQYLAEMGSAAEAPRPDRGLCRGPLAQPDTAAAITSNNAPVVIHGNTTATNPANGNAPSRYTGIATSPFSRSDFERIWGWIVQSSLWGDLTDEALLDQTITADTLSDKVRAMPTSRSRRHPRSGSIGRRAASGQCTVSSAVDTDDDPYHRRRVVHDHRVTAGRWQLQPGAGRGADDHDRAGRRNRDLHRRPDGVPRQERPTSATILLQATVIDTALAARLAGLRVGRYPHGDRDLQGRRHDTLRLRWPWH